MSGLELVCPAGTPSALEAAVAAGADAVYFGLRDRTNARNFPGLNFSPREAEDAVRTCRRHGVRAFLAVNTYPEAGAEQAWHEAVDLAAAIGVDALILADTGLADHAARKHPDLRLHLSVQASAANAEAVRFYQEAFGVRRVVLPRVLDVPAIGRLIAETGIEAEVFVFGGLCVMAEGRCSLSSYATGLSPNKDGVCSPAGHVRYDHEGDTLVSRLGGLTINRTGPGENAGYPTLCKGRFTVHGAAGHLFEDPASLDATRLLPDLQAAGVTALKVEGRQRGKAYVRDVVPRLRAAVDNAAPAALGGVMEGGRATTGAYEKGWR